MTAKSQAETIITTHQNADFDALAAMIAASRLYPGAALIFPGSQEKNLRHFFIQSATYLFNFQAAKDVDASAVKLLVLVDTRQKSRLGHVREILERPGVEIHAYDHHPDTDEDVRPDQLTLLPWGSTTAILALRLRDQGESLSTDEATVLGLGIYEDTGAFTFNSTTEHDLAAAAWLRGQGMDLNVISDLISRELTAEQVSILNSLLDSARTHEINGVPVVIAEATMEHYVGDFALLAHKFMDMENVRTLFALGRMADRVVLVARSRGPEVNVGQICGSFGGGGHPYAASATVKDRTLPQVKEELFALLYSQINAHLVAGKLMSRPAVSLDERETLAHALEVMARYNLKSLPVTRRDGECAGLLDRHIADKAVTHGLGEVAVSEYMIRDFSTVGPATNLYEVMEIILGRRQRLVPVCEEGRLAGVLTRTDLINILIDEPSRLPEMLLPERRRERNMASALKEKLPRELYAILLRAGELAAELGYAVYAVGGFVRDLVLGTPNQDLDLVVEGDGVAFAEALAGRLDGRVTPHQKFKTAVIVLPDGRHLDVATARLEYYEYPAALPTVELSSIKMDLYRRDFTINALAIRLDPAEFGRMIDFFGAQGDIRDRVVRVMHSLSFVEDPTRILRAIRFEQRYGFRISPETERLIKNAAQQGFFHQLSGGRIFNELRLICEEKSPVACLRRMQHFKLLTAIHPLLSLERNRETILEEAEHVLGWHRLLYLEPRPEPWRLFLLGLMAGVGDGESDIVLRRLNFPARQEADFLALRQAARQALGQVVHWQNTKGPLSELCFILENLPVEGVLYLMARSQKESVKKSVSLYLTQLRGQRIDISGKDLLAMGLPSGPTVGRILKAVRAARLDGQAACRADQLALAERLVRGAPPIAPRPVPTESESN